MEKASKTLKAWLQEHNHDATWLRAQIPELKSRQHAHIIINRIQRPSSAVAFKVQDMTLGEVTARWLLLGEMTESSEEVA